MDSEPLDAEDLAVLNGQARVIATLFAEIAGRPMPPGRDGVAFLDGFIERQRAKSDPKGYEPFNDPLGAYLGACLIAEHGGRWIEPCSPMVETGPDIVDSPFARIQWHFEEGISVLSYFDNWGLIYGPKSFKAQADRGGSS